MKRLLVFFFAGLMTMGSYGQQEPISLDLCYEKAMEHYPNRKQLDINREVTELNIKNIGTNYYPKLNLNSQVHYQSDVTKVPIPTNPAFSIPDIEKDWYKVNLDVEQMIYDGGLTNNQKAIAEAEYAISDQKIEVELYLIKEQVSQLYFNALFLRKSMEVIQVLKENLLAGIEEAQHAFSNGMILSSDVNALRVEYTIAEQQLTGLEEDLQGVLGALNELTQLQINTVDALETPQISLANYNYSNSRPEYLMLQLQKDKVSALQSLSSVKRRPVFAAFGQAGYGRPGYDMLSNQFDDYYMIGARLHWNIWDWSKVKREKQILDLQSHIITRQQETFDHNLKTTLHKRIAEINKYEKMIASDRLIVKLQKDVLHTADAQLKNGTITATTYLIELNKQVKAKLNLEAHKLYLVFSKYQYMITIGNL